MKTKLMLLTAALGLAAATSGRAQVTINTLNSAYTQDFNSLISTDGDSATYSDNTTITGWYVNSEEMDSNSDEYFAEDGTSNGGEVYSFGDDGDSDRALGYVGSGGNDYFNAAVRLVNSTGSTVTDVDLSYVGEQWRSGGNTSDNNNSLSFSYQTFSSGAGSIPTDTSASGYTADASFDFSAPQTSVAAGNLDGNLAANQTSFSGTLTGLNWQDGDELWLRWTGDNAGGIDAGLGIDDVSITAVPEPSTIILMSLVGLAAFGVLRGRKK